MDPIATVASTVILLKHIITYYEHFSQVLHTYSVLHDCRYVNNFEHSLKTIDATRSTLSQLLALAGINRDPSSKRFVNGQGLARAILLTSECFVELSRVELTITKCASHHVTAERHARRGTLLTSSDFLDTKNADPLVKSFDVNAFLVIVEKIRWIPIESDLERCIHRLEHLTQHIVLLTQVIELGQMCVSLHLLD